MLEQFLSLFQTNFFFKILSTIWKLIPIWVPLLFFTLFLQTWLRYKRTKWIIEQGGVLLEIRIPKEITKSPAAMEIVIGALSQPSVGTYLHVYLKGRVRPWFSLEMVSISGNVRFFVWTFAKQRGVVESAIYSQYPNVEIHEVPDYALDVRFNPAETTIYGVQMKLTKSDPFPIKTYIDYGLDKNPKEEEKVDPITPIIEFLGSMKPGEQAWVQILIQAHRSEGLKDVRIFKRGDWKDKAKAEIKKIIEKESFVKLEEGKAQTLQHLTDIQKMMINAIERSISKPAFNTMIRLSYLAKADIYDAVNIGGILGSFKQFNSNTLNGFAPNWKTYYEYPWEDFRGVRKTKNQRKFLNAYKRRSFFEAPYKHFHGKPFILTAEELATIYHFPGTVAETPSLSRIVSKKAEPPSNLPV